MNGHRIRALLALVVFALFASSSPARAEDYTDIWWAGDVEKGWGVNLIQSQDFIFATFFVYGPAPAKTPIWYVGNLERKANGTFNGGLYQTTGTGIGVDWMPGDYTPTPVGTATFTPTSTTTGTLAYNVNATQVTKSIQRQTLTTIALGGSYVGTGVVYTTGCTNAADNRTDYYDVDPVVTQIIGGPLQIVLTFAGQTFTETCTLAGAYTQEGLLFRIPSASYVCKAANTTTLDTTAMVYEVRATSVGLDGRWVAPSVGGGCQEDGSFAAVFP